MHRVTAVSSTTASNCANTEHVAMHVEAAARQRRHASSQAMAHSCRLQCSIQSDEQAEAFKMHCRLGEERRDIGTFRAAKRLSAKRLASRLLRPRSCTGCNFPPSVFGVEHSARGQHRIHRRLTHGAGDASGFPFSTTYTPSTRVAVLPLLWASCTTPAGTTNDSPALIVRGDWPSIRSCTSPSMT